MSTAGPSIAGSSPCAAPAETVWAVWTNPSGWRGDVIKAATIDRPFGIGAKITTTVKGYPPLTTAVTRVEPPRLWIGVAKAPGLTTTIEHVIEAAEVGTCLTERATFSGPLAGVAARLMGKRLETTFGATTAHCARLAEAAASAG
ncbi:SRPBCC family protein [Mycobacterium sp.]|jgi:hypothetical protein|uniref:SRPBCC family protein n=1 Tax=Mycobacterium sp. TaxID=1785 RepID=UPI002D43FF6F|nr:SRPBCC family protein [Mycobacterium sp.]HZA12447.1 SRPBCC family protein [Mycobacterium sp.]